MYVVTGGAGFIGSNLISGLNQRGIENILLVDDLTRTEKIKNVADLHVADYMHKDEFLGEIQNRKINDVKAIFHLGACSDTMVTDGRYVMENNFSFSKHLYEYCQVNNVQFIYASSASVYGANTTFREHPDNEYPLNAYAYSKFLFDRYVRSKENAKSHQVVGLRYFNVYGYREQHKPKMASVAFHFFNQYQQFKKVKLFAGSAGYENGEQRRDFVFIDDIVSTNLFFLDNPDKSGIFNVGTGRCQAFNDVAVAVINTLGASEGLPSRTREQLIEVGEIEYIPMPEILHGKYQSFTEADLDGLRSVGYSKSFSTVEQGVEKYVHWMLKNA